MSLVFSAPSPKENVQKREGREFLSTQEVITPFPEALPPEQKIAHSLGGPEVPSWKDELRVKEWPKQWVGELFVLVILPCAAQGASVGSSSWEG